MPRNIILIDDDEAESLLFRCSLQELGYDYPLIHFTNGEAALNYFREIQIPPFMIISDLNMPGWTGLDLLRKIHSEIRLKLKCTPFMICSNLENSGNISEAYACGAQAYFRKPRDLKEMNKMLRTIISYWETCRRPFLGELFRATQVTW